MGMSWCVALSESDAILISGAAEELLRGGIIPIVRFSYQFPDHWNETVAVEKLVAVYSKYNAPLIVQFANEPFDDREWRIDLPPRDEAWAIVADRWNEAARLITERGAYAGFPDGPSYGENPFDIIKDDDYLWADGDAVYLGHFYGKGRPENYPYDDVSRYGTQLTMEEYMEQLDDFAIDPGWNEGQYVLDLMNAQREDWADPTLTPIRDDVCWRGWEKVLYRSRATFGYDVQIAMTEGGWVPRDRAGSNPVDIRWPYTTPKMVGKKTLEMYNSGSPLFAICPWLLACEDMGGSGWPYDSWVGWAYSEMYGSEKPVVQMLQDNPPQKDAISVLDSAVADITEAMSLL